MDHSFLVAETPRAGKWNHRFLAAPGVQLEQGQARDWCERAARESEGERHLAAVRDVPQETTGRVGKELLVLANVPVEDLSTIDRQAIRERLEQLLHSKLANLMTGGNVEWDKGEKSLIVPCPQLAAWHAQEIRPLLEKAAQRPSQFNRPTREKTAHETPSSRPRWLWLVAAVLLVAVAAGVPDVGKGIKRWFSGRRATDSQQPDQRLVNSWCDLLGLPKPERTTSADELFSQINKKLRADLVIEDEQNQGALAGGTATQEPQAVQDTRGQLRDILGELYQVFFPDRIKEARRMEAEDLLRDDGLRNAVKTLYPAATAGNGQPTGGAVALNLLGWLASPLPGEKPDQRTLGRLRELHTTWVKEDVRALRRLIQKAGAVAEAAKDLKAVRRFGADRTRPTLVFLQKAGGYDFRDGETLRPNKSPSLSRGPHLAVLIRNDADAVNNLVDWLSSQEATEAYQRHNVDVRGHTVRDVLRTAEALTSNDDRFDEYCDYRSLRLKPLEGSRRDDSTCQAYHALTVFLLETKTFLDVLARSPGKRQQGD